jgi:serpin B
VDWHGSLVEALQGLGVRRAFDPSRADFTGLTREPLAISEVAHGAFTEVNEKGLEAAAATLVSALRGMMPMDPPKVVVVDRPFVFEISFGGVPMFLGVVEDPS